MRRVVGSALLALAAAVGGCVGLPPYVPGPGVQTSQLQLSPNIAKESLGMCTAAGSYSLVPKDGKVYVPDDSRVVIWYAFVASGYREISTCAPSIGFTPHHDAAYYADFEVRSQHCGLLVYRQDPQSRTGLALEPTIGRGICPATASR